MNRIMKAGVAMLAAVGLAAAQDMAPPAYTPDQLNNLVSRIALYPDPLLAQVLAAATFSDQIADAASFADANRNLQGPDLANAMTAANLPFDPSVQSLIPFPTVLDMMASDMNWTATLGNAVLAQRGDVMDAIQRMRQTAANYGYLTNNADERTVAEGGDIQIEPVDPNFVYVPVYDPAVVFAAPRPGFYIAGAIRFPFGFGVGVAFGGWGWGGGFYWPSHTVIVHNVAWGRTWANRDVYVHNYGTWNHGDWARTPVNRTVAVNNNRNVTFNSNRNQQVNNNVNVTRNTYRPPEQTMPVRNNQPTFTRPVTQPTYSRPANEPTFNRPVNQPTFSRPVMQPTNNRPAPPVMQSSNRPTFQRPAVQQRPAPQQQSHFTPQARGGGGNSGRGGHR